MIQLYVVVEGETEGVFVKDVLAKHLLEFEVMASATIVGKAGAQRRGDKNRGGGNFATWRNDIGRLLSNRTWSGFRVTTLFDLYGLPKDFPNLDEHGSDTNTNHRCDKLIQALGAEFNDHRFIPYIQRHEFEALVLASLEQLRNWFEEDALLGLDQLQQEIGDTPPEDINDGSATAPSKRLEAAIAGYRKTVHGPTAIEDMGLVAIRERCPRFDEWVKVLEELGRVE